MDLLGDDVPYVSGDPRSLDVLHNAVMAKAREVLAWYDRRRARQRLGARGLRLLAILLGAAASLLPMGVSLAHTAGAGARAAALLPASSILGVLAATCVLLDKFFGCSSSWMRYTATSLELQARAESFNLAWRAVRLRLQRDQAGEPVPTEALQGALALHLQFLDNLNELVRGETHGWLAEFKGVLAPSEGAGRKSESAPAE